MLTVVIERFVDVRCPICHRLLCRAADGSVVQIKCRHDGVQTSQVRDGRSTAVTIRATPQAARDFELDPVCPVPGVTIDA